MNKGIFQIIFTFVQIGAHCFQGSEAFTFRVALKSFRPALKSLSLRRLRRQLRAPPSPKPLDAQLHNISSHPMGPNAFLAALTPKLLEYVQSQGDTSVPTVQFAGPRQIFEAFEAAGCPLPLGGAEACDAANLLEACDRILDFSVRTSSPLFNNQLYGASDPVGIGGDFMAAALNPSSYTYEVAPVFTLMETELVVKLGLSLGGGFANRTQVDGLFVPGGSLSNLYALHVARHRACPQVKTQGNAAAGQLCAFVSDEAHYSYEKACSLLGLGTDNLVKVPTHPVTGAMNPCELKRLLHEAVARGQKPFFVGCTAGTTVLGAFDPFTKVRKVVDEFSAGAQGSVWMHVDGAWGGAALFSRRERAKCMEGAELADSFCTNPHKLLGAPQQCCCFLTRHPRLLLASNSASAAYLFQPDKEHGDLDYGDKTIQCGRKVDTLKLWLMWKYLGDEGMERRVDGLVNLASYFSRRIRTQVDGRGRRCFAQVAPTSLTNVVFYAIPPSMRVDPACSEGVGAAATEEGLEAELALLARLNLADLAAVAPATKKALQRSGGALVTFQPVKQFPNCWRMVFAGAKEQVGMTEATVDEILDSISDAAANIFG